MAQPTRKAAPPAIPAPELIRSLVRPLFGVFGGPAAWTLQLLLGYGLANYPCMPNDVPYASMPPSWSWDRPVLFGVNLFCLLAALASGYVGTTDFLRMRTWKEHGPLEARRDRMRFLAYCGFLSSWLFVAAILFNTVNLIWGPSCSG